MNLLSLSTVSASVLMPIGAAFSFTIGGVFMQLSEGLSKPFFSLMVYLMFAVGASFQAIATHYSGMGLTYIVVLGLEAILALLFSIFLFQEGCSALKLAGVFLVVVGVIFLRSG
ncbi:MAG TPA: SMR family transporter [Crinalium sp.]|jgi:small multidrug resistance pump/quaternary ammonium compound-resistance protein SugE